MVIDHNHVDPFGLEPFDFQLRISPTVQSDEELGLGFGQHALQGGHREAIPFLQATRDEVFRMRT